MLTPDYYFNCTDDIIELYSRLDQSITRDIARRIVKAGYVTEGAKWQIQVERDAGLLYDDIISTIAEYTETSESAVKALFEDAGITSKEFDDKIYKEAGKSPVPLKSSQAMLQVLQAGIEKTNGLLSNLTKTTALSAQTAFIDACTLAEMEITSGAFDYNTAIRHAVDSAISQGCYVEYASGARTTLEAAVRRAVRTGVSQTTGEISLANAKDMDTDLMEITAHGGARPSHAVWQGQIVCISGKRSGYLTLSDIGYGDVTGFKGANCRHDWYPFLEGVSILAHTKKELEDLKNATVTYDGKEIPLYEAQQKQRAMERLIREDKRKLSGYDEAIRSTKDDEIKQSLQSEFDRLSMGLKNHENKYKEFSKKTGLKTQTERTQVHGYTQSLSQKVLQTDKNLFNKINDIFPEEIKPKSIEEFNKICYNPDNKTLQFLSKISYEDAEKLRPLYNDRVVRSWYINHNKNIPNEIDKTLPLEEQAKQACQLRNKNKENARNLMHDQNSRNQLDKDEPTVSFEKMIERKMNQGFSGENIYKAIIESSTKTRKSVNKKYGLE